MLIYIFLWIFVVICAVIFKSRRLHPKYFLIVAFGGMAIVLGLRNASVGEDTAMYLAIAKSASNLTWSSILSGFPKVEWNFISYGWQGGYSERVETLYMLYNKLIMSVFRDPQWVLLITAIITNTLMAKYILNNVNDKKDIYFATYIYMCDAFFMNSFNTMRQILAMSVAVQSIQEVKDHRYKRAATWIIVASCFHQSAILFAFVCILYVFQNKKKYYKYLLIGTCALPMAIPVLIQVAKLISPVYASYLQVSYWEAQARGVIILWVIIIVIVMVAAKSKRSTEYDWWLIYMATLYIGVEIIALRLTVVARVAMYFRIGLVFLYPEAKKYFSGKKGQLIYTLLIVILVTFSYLSYARSPVRLYSFFF